MLGPVGYYLRTRVAETPAFQRAEAARDLTRVPLAEAFTTHGWVFLAAFGVSIIGCVINYVFLVFLPSFASQTLHIDLSRALWSTTIAGLIYLVLTPLVGHWSDRIGRKPMMLGCAVLAFVMAYPLFLFLVSHPTFWGLLVVQATAQAILTLYTGVISTILSEMFPTNVRYTALSVSYGFAVAIFGGFAPVYRDVAGQADRRSAGAELLRHGGGRGERRSPCCSSRPATALPRSPDQRAPDQRLPTPPALPPMPEPPAGSPATVSLVWRVRRWSRRAITAPRSAGGLPIVTPSAPPVSALSAEVPR